MKYAGVPRDRAAGVSPVPGGSAVAVQDCIPEERIGCIRQQSAVGLSYCASHDQPLLHRAGFPALGADT